MHLYGQNWLCEKKKKHRRIVEWSNFSKFLTLKKEEFYSPQSILNFDLNANNPQKII